MGGNLNAQDKQGSNSPTRCGYQPERKAIEILIQAGADVNIRDHHGLLASDLATKFNGNSLTPTLLKTTEEKWQGTSKHYPQESPQDIFVAILNQLHQIPWNRASNL